MTARRCRRLPCCLALTCALPAWCNSLAPQLAWVQREKLRLGYNYCAPLEWYPRARQCGLNGIISRLEIANSSAGDEEPARRLRPGSREPEAVRCWRMVRPSSQAAKENGLHFFYMLNLGGTRGNIDDGFRDNDRRFNNGELFSPLDDVYWRRVVENRFLRVLDMLEGDEYQLDGLLIDPEMYAAGGATPGGMDYGDYALSEFFRATRKKADFTGLSIAQRGELIQRRGLHDRLYRFQFERIRDLAAGTRRRVDARRPGLILGFFLWKDALWFRAVAAGFATPSMPCFVGPESTYPGGFDDAFLEYVARVRRQAGVPILLAPGLRFGREEGETPRERLRVLPGNLYHRSIHTDGYWLWALSRMGDKEKERRPFLQLLRTVNDELDRWTSSEGRYQSYLQPSPLPVDKPPQLDQLLESATEWEAAPPRSIPQAAPSATGFCLRGQHTFIMLAQAGERVSFSVRHLRLGRYLAPVSATVYGTHESHSLPPVSLGQQRSWTYTPSQSGVLALAVTAHNNAFWILPESAPCALATRGPVHLCKQPPGECNRLFFYVPEGVRRFRVAMTASATESAVFRIYDSRGRQRLHRRVDSAITVDIDCGADAGRVWWAETDSAVEDHSLKLLDIPNLFAARPDQLPAP